MLRLIYGCMSAVSHNLKSCPQTLVASPREYLIASNDRHLAPCVVRNADLSNA